MNWLANRSTQTKLLLSFGLVFLALLWIVCSASTVIGEMKTRQESILNVQLPTALDFMALSENINHMRVCVQMILLVDDSTVFDKQVDEIKSIIQQTDQLLPRLQSESRGNTKALASLNEVRDFLKDYKGSKGDQLFIRFTSARGDDSQKMSVLRQQRNAFKKILNLLSELGDLSLAGVQQQIRISATQADEAVKPFPFVCAAVICIVAVMVSVLNKLIADPLKKLTVIAKEIMDGKSQFSTTGLDTQRNDEVGALTRAFVTMSSMMLNDLSGAIRQVNDAVDVLGVSIGQIMDSVTNSATGVAQTSSAVSETTSVVQEVRQTAHVASEMARQVASSAEEAAEVSRQGQEAADQTIDGMTRIRAQMDSIRSSMLQLADKTRAIEEVNATVEQLARQAKLLSVNAAIEAIKAGQQGVGFAVVVEEVQQMSRESKQATALVRTILNDIHSATEVARQSIEVGVVAVDEVSKKSAEAGDSIRKLTEGVKGSAMAASQIASSSQEQLLGVDQVASAMVGIKDAAYQNLQTIHQVESATQNLETLSNRLKLMLSTIKIADGTETNAG